MHTWSALSGWWKTFYSFCVCALLSSKAQMPLWYLVKLFKGIIFYSLWGICFFTGTSTHGVVSFQHTALCAVWARKPQNMKGLLVKTLQSGKGVILFCISKWGAAKDQSITEAYCACTCVVVSFTPRHLFNKHTMMMGCPKTLHCLRFRMISTMNDYILPMIY